MLPIIAIVGRPNVGKSTFFNRLTGTKDALVADFSGLTRDRIYGHMSHQSLEAIMIDTGGLVHDHGDLPSGGAIRSWPCLDSSVGRASD